MATIIRRVFYYNMTVRDRPGEAYKTLTRLKDLGVNLLGFAAFPVGPVHTRLTLFPEDSGILAHEAKQENLVVDGPYPCLLVQGDDELGALVEIHEKLYEADVNVYASTCVADGKGGYGYILYIRSDKFDVAVKALGI
jgi:hypothetical protein